VKKEKEAADTLSAEHAALRELVSALAETMVVPLATAGHADEQHRAQRDRSVYFRALIDDIDHQGAPDIRATSRLIRKYTETDGIIAYPVYGQGGAQ